MAMRQLVQRIFVFFMVVQMASSASAQNWDAELLKSINPEHPTSAFWLQISNSAYWVPVIIPVSTMGYGILAKNRTAKCNAVELALNIGMSTLITHGLKYSIQRKRPGDEYPGQIFPNTPNHDGLSFPSGHTSIAFGVAATLALDYKKWYVTVPAFAWASSVGYSRMYLGKHYPSDVLGGALVGIGSSYLSHWLNGKLFTPKPEKVPVLD